METRALVASIAVLLLACSETASPGHDGGSQSLDARTRPEDADPRDDASAEPDDASAEHDDSGLATDGDAGEAVPSVDCFGTRALHRTIPGGREWCLPSDPTRA